LRGLLLSSLRTAVLALALLLAVAAPAFAQGLSGAQQQALADRIAGFDTAMRTSDMSGVLGVLPPKVLEHLATKNGISTADLITSAQQQIDEALKTIRIESFGMNLDDADVITLPNGTTYAMIPTETVMNLGESGKFKSSTMTLGLLDGETWYLMAVDDVEQATIVREVYPGLAEVEFPKGSMEPVTE
jgi:hypothetical protein